MVCFWGARIWIFYATSTPHSTQKRVNDFEIPKLSNLFKSHWKKGLNPWCSNPASPRKVGETFWCLKHFQGQRVEYMLNWEKTVEGRVSILDMFNPHNPKKNGNSLKSQYLKLLDGHLWEFTKFTVKFSIQKEIGASNFSGFIFDRLDQRWSDFPFLSRVFWFFHPNQIWSNQVKSHHSYRLIRFLKVRSDLIRFFIFGFELFHFSHPLKRSLTKSDHAIKSDQNLCLVGFLMVWSDLVRFSFSDLS